jgi:DNA-binding NarL/FixJ family response regulator
MMCARVCAAVKRDDIRCVTGIRLLLVGRPRVFLEALAARLHATPDIDIVGSVTPPTAVGLAVGRGDIDVALVDLGLSTEEILAVTDAVRAGTPPPALVVLGEGDIEVQATTAVAAGCTGWVSPGDGVAELVDTVRGVRRGETRVPLDLLVGALHQLHRDGRLPTVEDRRLATLTTRERQVLDLLAEGCPRHVVARRLRISSNTVRTHQQHVLTKLGVHTTLAAVSLLREADRPVVLEPRRAPSLVVAD